MTGTGSSASRLEPLPALAEEILSIHRETYGKGAERTDAYLTGDSVVCFLDGLELLPNEAFMLERDMGDAIVDIRERYQEAVGATFIAAVERATGRRVTSFLSKMSLNPHFVVEIFRLAPEQPGRAFCPARSAAGPSVGRERRPAVRCERQRGRHGQG